ncbi:hypothetical protein GCM10028827_23930 [Mucilaginibacter myungsuensis]
MSPSSAQSQPNIQNQGAPAPSNIKIDGNMAEWGNKFEAYNRLNYLHYTMANDAENLYLIVYAKDRTAIKKILYGGITLTIESPKVKGGNKKGDSSNVRFRFPVPDASIQKVQSSFSVFNSGGLHNDILDTLKTTAQKRDSIAGILNAKVETMFKEIEISGIKAMSEPLLSVYNADGLKAAAKFDSHLQYTYELAIPLKYLSTGITSGTKFKYSIKENGRPTTEKVNGEDFPVPMMVSFGGAPPDHTDLDVFSPTEFSGSYMLIKK